jgi:hypothetical protein
MANWGWQAPAIHNRAGSNLDVYRISRTEGQISGLLIIKENKAALKTPYLKSLIVSVVGKRGGGVLVEVVLSANVRDMDFCCKSQTKRSRWFRGNVPPLLEQGQLENSRSTQCKFT